MYFVAHIGVIGYAVVVGVVVGGVVVGVTCVGGSLISGKSIRYPKYRPFIFQAQYSLLLHKSLNIGRTPHSYPVHKDRQDMKDLCDE